MSDSLRIWAAVVLLAGAATAAPAEEKGAADSRELEPGIPAEIYVAPGRATTILFRSGEKVAAISLASPVITYKYDRSLNQLEITPVVRSGGFETNLNLRIGGNVYVLLVKVVDDIRAQFFRDFTLAGDPGDDDEEGLTAARPLPPAEVDLIGAAKTLGRAEADPVFRRAHPNLRFEAIDRDTSWNDCRIRLVEAAQFLDLDLLVFLVRWTNRTPDALYLDPRQYSLSVAGRNIPIVARYKIGIGPIVAPGETESVYLAVQGYRLSRRNDWRLCLPPDAAALSGLGLE